MAQERFDQLLDRLLRGQQQGQGHPTDRTSAQEEKEQGPVAAEEAEALLARIEQVLQEVSPERREALEDALLSVCKRLDACKDVPEDAKAMAIVELARIRRWL